MVKLLEENKLILMEGAVLERLRRTSNVAIHPLLANAHLIYSTEGRKKLKNIYNSYINLAKEADIPFLMCAPTWRANRLRVSESAINNDINVDAVNFMKEIRESYTVFSHKISIGGMIGCKNDCYKPEEGLSVKESELFHEWQVEQLVKGKADFLVAETLPNVNEALGIARCLEKAGLPYIISFVISRNGTVLDGTKLNEAIGIIDKAVSDKPICYFVNCAHPSFLCAEIQPRVLFDRLTGYLGNASSLDHYKLDGSRSVKIDNVSNWGKQMLEFNRKFNMKILGGCCGTNVKHLKYIIENWIF